MSLQAAELDENISFAILKSRKISLILLVGLRKKSCSKLRFVEIALQISSKHYKIQ